MRLSVFVRGTNSKAPFGPFELEAERRGCGMALATHAPGAMRGCGRHKRLEKPSCRLVLV